MTGTPVAQPGHRIVLTGSESTGKTILTERLAAHYRVPWIPEYAREYALRKGAPLDVVDVEPIARGQLALEARGLRQAGPLVIYDTDLLSTAVYAKHYYDWCPPWVESAARGRSGRYLLLDIDVPWFPDRTRGPASRRRELHQRFLRELESAGVAWSLIGGDYEERFLKAIAEIDAVLPYFPAIPQPESQESRHVQ